MKVNLSAFQAQRLKICATCSHRKIDAKNVERCEICGCRIATRVWVSCPKRKW